ncbi:hypothetical protein BpHYR1_015774 [Brachionus plicatilis]|uniref:Uncharacterized protein n=1 Tax=Brachionus plicatilis TaxID=10195 RepID=A0A3M7R0G2_BRAPC|nr:hypothetical protein BpHYR1_015774 [Brachionus plicatilis]
MRVLIMLYMPWFDEKKEVEVANLLRVLEANRHEIVVNRAKFESIVSENFDKAQEEIEKEINEFYEQLMENEVQQLDDASDNLARNFIHDGSIREMDDEETLVIKLLCSTKIVKRRICWNNDIEMPGEVCECKSIYVAVGSAEDSKNAINLAAN